MLLQLLAHSRSPCRLSARPRRHPLERKTPTVGEFVTSFPRLQKRLVCLQPLNPAHTWCSGSTTAFQAAGPGSIPGVCRLCEVQHALAESMHGTLGVRDFFVSCRVTTLRAGAACLPDSGSLFASRTSNTTVVKAVPRSTHTHTHTHTHTASNLYFSIVCAYIHALVRPRHLSRASPCLAGLSGWCRGAFS